MLLYIIQAHQKPGQIRQLIELLDDGANRYIVNVDPTAGLDLAALRADLPEAIAPRITVRRSLPATWGGISQVHAWLDVYNFAVNHVEGWAYAAILSGTCIPIVPQPRIKRALRTQYAAGVRMHFCWWGWEERGELFHTLPMGGRDGAETNFVKMVLGGGGVATVDSELVKIFKSGKTSPLGKAHWRGAVYCTEVPGEKRLIVRRLLPEEAATRRKQMQEMPTTGGWVWSVLRRDALEQILAEPILPDVLNMLSHFICADELFFHTLVRNSARFREEKLGPKNFHFRNGWKTVITDNHIKPLQNSGAFFARKVDYEQCPGLIEHVRQLAAASRARH